MEPRGHAATGRILKLFVGHGHGVIRAAVGDDVYFHRADLEAGTSINDFSVGDAVAFELLADNISGPRALRVRRDQDVNARQHRKTVYRQLEKRSAQ